MQVRRLRLYLPVPSVTDWACPAYGAEGREVGALCFFAAVGKRLCESEPECQGRLIVERSRVFARIQELAEEGDPVGRHLAAEFPDPDQLLGGAEPDLSDEDSRNPRHLTKAGRVLTEEDLDRYAAEAEEGYDLDKLIPLPMNRDKPPDQDE